MSIEYLIFDLDNTLYPSSAQMDKGITTRMMNCVAEFFNTSYEEAVKIRRDYIKNIFAENCSIFWNRYFISKFICWIVVFVQ